MNSKNSTNSANSKRRTPPWFLGAFVFVLLSLLVLLQSSNLWKELEVQSASDTLLLYALSSLNFFAFIIFGFIFVRSLIKLRRERNALQLGSQIKTKLLIYFFAVSIMPIVAMAVFSYLFMNRALDRWFTDIPENVIREAQRVQNQSIEDQTVRLGETAGMLATTLDERNINDAVLGEIVESGNLARLEILSENGDILASSEKRLDAAQRAELNKTLAFIHQNRLAEKIFGDGRDFDAAIAPMSGGRMLIVVPDLRPAGNVSTIVENSLVEFEKLKQKQVSVRQIGLLILGFLTFLLIFASSWTAFYIARGLTVPIRALAEGADEIARGNLSHRVGVPAEDELALLVSTFNQMSAKLEENSAELLDRRKYIETVLQSLTTGVVSFDGENRVTTINKAAVQMLKLEDADFAGSDLSRLVTEENRRILERLLARARRIGQASEQTVLRRESSVENTDAAVTELPVALSATSLPKTTDAEASGAVLVIEDLSELLAAQRASAWQEVARRMAHEIKNPLTPIQLSAERIAKIFYRNLSAASSESVIAAADKKSALSGSGGQITGDAGQLSKVVKEGTETILREVNSLKLMVDEFSRFARLPDAKLEYGKLNESVEQAVAAYEERFGDVKIVLNLAGNLPEILLDDEQMRRVFVNLIENSIEAFGATAGEKQISIKTYHDAARDLIVSEVADNGVGIATADFSKLFQPYFSTKGRGTGLGLAIVHRIVGEHRGRIKAVFNKPAGAKFIIEIPAAQ